VPCRPPSPWTPSGTIITPPRNVLPPPRSDVRCQGQSAVFRPPQTELALAAIQACKAGDGTAGRRLTFSDARIGYRLSGFRPGLVPVLRRASAHSRPQSGCGISPPWPRPQPCTTDFIVAISFVLQNVASHDRTLCLGRRDRRRRDVLSYRPQECREFTRDRRCRDAGLLAFGK